MFSRTGPTNLNDVRTLCAGGVLGGSGAIALPCLGEHAGTKQRHSDGTQAKESAN